jgi:cytochrome c oxidase subunit 4
MSTADTQGRMHGEPEEPHGATVATPHHHVNYLAIFVALVLLTILTVLVAFHRFESEAVNLAVAMVIAASKASLVALFFMHMKFEGKMIHVIFIVPLLLCVLLTVALIPDILLTTPGSHSASLHLFNPVQHLFQMALGAE